MKRLLLVSAVALIPAAATAGAIVDDVKVDQVHRGMLNAGRNHIPLPDGDWVVIGVNETKNSSNSVLVEIDMAKFEGKEFSGYIVINVNQDISGGGWVQNKFCARTDVYYIVRDADTATNQSCWGVNHYVWEKTSTYKPTTGSNIQSYLANRGQTMPPVMIEALYRVANNASYLTYQVFTNPGLQGFHDEPGKWTDSSWHKDLVKTDPKRVEFLEHFKAQSAPIYDRIKDGGLYRDAAGSAASPAGVGAAIGAAAGAAGDVSTVEQRLTKLKDLFDRGLVSQAEYDAKRKQILDGL